MKFYSMGHYFAVSMYKVQFFESTKPQKKLICTLKPSQKFNFFSTFNYTKPDNKNYPTIKTEKI